MNIQIQNSQMIRISERKEVEGAMSKENEKLKQKLHVLGYFIILIGLLLIFSPYVSKFLSNFGEGIWISVGIIIVFLGLYLAS